MVFRAVISKEEDCYMANIPSLKHCFAGGDTIEEAISNLKEALEGTLESMQARNIAIADDSGLMEFTLNVSDNYKFEPDFKQLTTA
jgi:antitoxin HicB